jgi:hypothetical protein
MEVTMEADDFGTEQVTAEDRFYRGSRFGDVKAAIFAKPYQAVWGREGASPLPRYETTVANVFRGLLPFGRHYVFRQASERAVDSHADLRWGDDRKGFRRILHPNGICLTGVWEITEDNEYSGYFRRGSRALTIARYSTCCTEPRRGHVRSLSLVGKLYPTTDADHVELLRTASFFTQQDIGGDTTDYINDVELLNAPDVSPWRRGKQILFIVMEGVVFTLVDKQATIRQLHPIAELGKPTGEPTRAPKFMRLLVGADQPRIEGASLDFRDEVMAQIFDRGDASPKRRLRFNIEVTDDGTTRDILGFVRRKFANWRRIGKLTFDNAVASYNGDFVLHFNHPNWRDDPNNPATANRPPLS